MCKTFFINMLLVSLPFANKREMEPFESIYHEENGIVESFSLHYPSLYDMTMMIIPMTAIVASFEYSPRY